MVKLQKYPASYYSNLKPQKIMSLLDNLENEPSSDENESHKKYLKQIKPKKPPKPIAIFCLNAAVTFKKSHTW